VNKLKIYLDTSVISHLDAPDTPEKMEDTLRFWDEIKLEKYNVVLSKITLEELGKCRKQKYDVLTNFLGLIKYKLVDINELTFEIAGKFIDFGILRQKSFDDCKHIATAITSNCNAIVSWNFKHIVAHKTMLGVKSVTALYGRSDLLIYTPQSLLSFKGGDDDDK
jgi:predicted nucleic acid-binding protein